MLLGLIKKHVANYVIAGRFACVMTWEQTVMPVTDPLLCFDSCWLHVRNQLTFYSTAVDPRGEGAVGKDFDSSIVGIATWQFIFMLTF